MNVKIVAPSQIGTLGLIVFFIRYPIVINKFAKYDPPPALVSFVNSEINPLRFR